MLHVVQAMQPYGIFFSPFFAFERAFFVCTFVENELIKVKFNSLEAFNCEFFLIQKIPRKLNYNRLKDGQ